MVHPGDPGAMQDGAAKKQYHTPEFVRQGSFSDVTSADTNPGPGDNIYGPDFSDQVS